MPSSNNCGTIAETLFHAYVFNNHYRLFRVVLPRICGHLAFREKDVHDAEKKSALCNLFSPADERSPLLCYSAVDRLPSSLEM